MFEFFAALFGGAYYAGKYAKEKSNDRAYDAQQRAKQIFIDRIHASTELEWEIDKMIKDPNRVYEVLREDLIQIFGKDKYRTSLILTPYSSPLRRPDNHAYWCKLLLLSKKGKLPMGACYEIPIDRNNEAFCIAILRQIEANMKKFVPNIKLVNHPYKLWHMTFMQA